MLTKKEWVSGSLKCQRYVDFNRPNYVVKISTRGKWAQLIDGKKTPKNVQRSLKMPTKANIWHDYNIVNAMTEKSIQIYVARSD